MIRRYSIAPSARVDLDDIWLYIAQQSSVEVAESVVEAITGIFPLLAANPAMGRHRPNLGAGMRSFPVSNYLLPARQSQGCSNSSRQACRPRRGETFELGDCMFSTWEPRGHRSREQMIGWVEGESNTSRIGIRWGRACLAVSAKASGQGLTDSPFLREATASRSRKTAPALWEAVDVFPAPSLRNRGKRRRITASPRLTVVPARWVVCIDCQRRASTTQPSREVLPALESANHRRLDPTSGFLDP